MKNSYVCSILGLYAGIFKDARVALPSVTGLGRDESRLLFTVQTRGMRYLTIDMPAFGKHFDKCLAEGCLRPSNIPGFGVKRGGAMPVFLRGLLLRVFDEHGVLLSHPCHTSIFLIRQLCNGAKKVKVDCSEEVREQALRTYLQQELSLRCPNLNWYGCRLDTRGGRDLHLVGHDEHDVADLFGSAAEIRALCDTVHDVADRVFSSFGEFNPEEWRPKHGPGAVADGAGITYKYDFPTWSQRLEGIFPSSLFAFVNYGAWVDSVRAGSVPLEKEVPSVVLTVPKSQKAPRIIAKEPVANMWCQQIIRDYLESNVESSVLSRCISFRDQRNNQKAAIKASLDGLDWTVDLSNASDRVSLWLVERLIRKNPTLLEALASSRSQYCEVPLRTGTELLRMKKFAPQGSATTFPLQTIIYAVLAIASVINARRQQVTAKTIASAAREVRVFGDDTVIPAYAGEQYVQVLTYCGFLVNYDKTFATGKFRESCGVEVYDGTDVTPAYITHPYDESSPSSIASTVECSNNFFSKGLWHAAAALESTLPHWVRKELRVVRIGEGAFGLTSYVGTDESHLRAAYNGDLHREEVRALTISTSVSRTQPGGYGHLLQYFTEAPTPDIQWMSGVSGRPALRVARRWEPALTERN